jgi:hypothetical protein
MANTLEVLNAAKIAFYDNRPTAFLVQTSFGSIPNTTLTPLSFQVANYDKWGAWSSGANTRYTAQVAGIYAVSGYVTWVPNGTGTRIGTIMYNGSGVQGGESENAAVNGTNNATSVAPPILISAAVGDYFQLGAYQSSGGSLFTDVAGTLAPSMTVQFVRFP